MLWEQLVRRTREGKGRHSDNSHGRSFPKRRKWRATSWHLCELFYCYGALLNLYQSLPIFTNLYNIQQDSTGHSFSVESPQKSHTKVPIHAFQEDCMLTDKLWLITIEALLGSGCDNGLLVVDVTDVELKNVCHLWIISPNGQMENIYKYLKSSPASRRLTLLPFMKKETNHKGVTIWQLSGQVFLPNSDWILDQCILPTAMNNHDHNPHNSIQFTQTISEINN